MTHRVCLINETRGVNLLVKQGMQIVVCHFPDSLKIHGKHYEINLKQIMYMDEYSHTSRAPHTVLAGDSVAPRLSNKANSIQDVESKDSGLS